jgi:hypothetical protein
LGGAARRPAGEERASSALVSAALGAALVGLLGADAGLVWLIAGVWTVRAISGSSTGVGWGVACLAAGLRWGTISLGDVEVATRLAGPTLQTGAFALRIGMAVAFGAALIDEARIAGLRSDSRAEQGAAIVALVALVALFGVAGPQEPFATALGRWAAGTALLVAVVLGAGRAMGRVPAWVPTIPAVAGLVVSVLAT